ncbi:LLM class flavin-dependent oxidoreductase [Dactylosporangium sp. CA-092794]|uniref:LLM class flavin-dependent oxidoreductase n=1 Tax=Dactylosporangium sp. CA-092794 TaxID=3239929 RepID=UPI003D8DF3C1
MELSLYLYPVAADATGLRELWTRFDSQATAADEAGWRGVWTPEHHQAKAFFPPPFQLLSWLAARHPRMTTGTAVALAPLYHPVQLAEAIATTASVSAGTVVGFGTGFRRREFAAVGADPAEKLAMTRECIRQTRALLAGESVTFSIGPWQARETVLPFVIDPAPRFLAAARTRPELDALAEVADGVVPNPMAGLDRQVALLREMDDRLGRPAVVRPVLADVVWGPTAQEATRRAIRRLGAEFGSFKHQQSSVSDIARFAAAPETEVDVIHRYCIVGDDERIRERLEWLAAEGVTELVARVEQAATGSDEALETIRALGRIWPGRPSVEMERLTHA